MSLAEVFKSKSVHVHDFCLLLKKLIINIINSNKEIRSQF